MKRKGVVIWDLKDIPLGGLKELIFFRHIITGVKTSRNQGVHYIQSMDNCQYLNLWLQGVFFFFIFMIFWTKKHKRILCFCRVVFILFAKILFALFVYLLKIEGKKKIISRKHFYYKKRKQITSGTIHIKFMIIWHYLNNILVGNVFIVSNCHTFINILNI